MSESECCPTVRRLESDDGLTIIELMIAALIVMIAFAALASTVIASFSAIRSNENRVTATALANEAIEDMTTMPWGQVGIREGEAPAEFDDNGTYTYSHGELIVVLSDDEGVPDQHETSVFRDGREYEVERMVTWFEEGGGPALKRMIVWVRWDDGARSVRTEGLRAPDPGDIPELEIRFLGLGKLENDTFEGRMHLDENLENKEVITARIEVGVGSASVVLTFRDRDENLQTYTFPNVHEDKVDITDATVSEKAHKFRHGPVSFTATATGADGQTATAVKVMHFYQDLEIDRVDAFEGLLDDRAGEDDQAADVVVLCEEDATLAEPITVEAEVFGLSPAEATDFGSLTLQWRFRPAEDDEHSYPSDPYEFGAIVATDDGGIYQVNLDAGTPFADSGDHVSGGDLLQFVVDAERNVVDPDETEIEKFHDKDDTWDSVDRWPVELRTCDV